MSLEIAAGLRETARQMRDIAIRIPDAGDRNALERIAARLIDMADRLERDARD